MSNLSEWWKRGDWKPSGWKRCWFTLMDSIPTWIKGVLLLIFSLLLFLVYEIAFDKMARALAELRQPSASLMQVPSSESRPGQGAESAGTPGGSGRRYAPVWTRLRQIAFFLWAALVVYWGLWPPRPDDVPPLEDRWKREIARMMDMNRDGVIDNCVRMAWQRELVPLREQINYGIEKGVVDGTSELSERIAEGAGQIRELQRRLNELGVKGRNVEPPTDTL